MQAKLGKRQEGDDDPCPDLEWISDDDTDDESMDERRAPKESSKVFPADVGGETFDGVHEPKWVQIVGGPFTKADELCVDLRRLQQRSGCSDKTCDDILRTFSKYLSLDAPINFRKQDKKLQEFAGATVLRLNGCPRCNKHVYLPTDGDASCPYVFTKSDLNDESVTIDAVEGEVCGHNRYDENGKALEVIHHNL